MDRAQLECRISSTNSKFITTLYSIINSATGKYCSVAFICEGNTVGFDPQTLRYSRLVKHNKQCHRKVFLTSFQWSGNTEGFYPQRKSLMISTART